MASPVDQRASASPTTTTNDWTTQLAGTVDNVVGTIRDKTTVPAETLARALVYGILVAVMGGTSLVLLTTGLVRLLDNWLRIWAVYLIVGGVFTAGGMLCWAFRRPRKRG
jgi:hypothetical protein